MSQDKLSINIEEAMSIINDISTVEATTRDLMQSIEKDLFKIDRYMTTRNYNTAYSSPIYTAASIHTVGCKNAVNDLQKFMKSGISQNFMFALERIMGADLTEAKEILKRKGINTNNYKPMNFVIPTVTESIILTFLGIYNSIKNTSVSTYKYILNLKGGADGTLAGLTGTYDYVVKFDGDDFKQLLCGINKDAKDVLMNMCIIDSESIGNQVLSIADKLLNLIGDGKTLEEAIQKLSPDEMGLITKYLKDLTSKVNGGLSSKGVNIKFTEDSLLSIIGEFVNGISKYSELRNLIKNRDALEGLYETLKLTGNRDILAAYDSLMMDVYAPFAACLGDASLNLTLEAAIAQTALYYPVVFSVKGGLEIGGAISDLAFNTGSFSDTYNQMIVCAQISDNIAVSLNGLKTAFFENPCSETYDNLFNAMEHKLQADYVGNSLAYELFKSQEKGFFTSFKNGEEGMEQMQVCMDACKNEMDSLRAFKSEKNSFIEAVKQGVKESPFFKSVSFYGD